MRSVGIEIAEARAAERIQRVDRRVGVEDVGLVAGVPDAELVGAGEHVALGVRPGVEALHLQLLVTQPETDVDRLVIGLALAVPDAEVAELGEAAGGLGIAVGVEERVGAETERNVAIARRDTVDRE